MGTRWWRRTTGGSETCVGWKELRSHIHVIINHLIYLSFRKPGLQLLYSPLINNGFKQLVTPLKIRNLSLQLDHQHA